MRTLNLLATFTTSLVLASAAVASENSAGLTDEQAARIQLERDLTNFICGNPDEVKAEDSGRIVDPAQTEIFAKDLAAQATSLDDRGDDLSTTQPASSAGDVSDPEILQPAAQDNPADLTGDGIVDVDDILMVLQGWGGCSPTGITQCVGDVTLDGYVNQHDLLLLFMHWN